MKRAIFVLAATALGALSLAGCNDNQSRDRSDHDDAMVVESAPAPEVEPEAPPPAPAVTDPAPTPAPEVVPEEKRTSEQSVQPESETLFY